jgi:hypothetical protein
LKPAGIFFRPLSWLQKSADWANFSRSDPTAFHRKKRWKQELTRRKPGGLRNVTKKLSGGLEKMSDRNHPTSPSNSDEGDNEGVRDLKGDDSNEIAGVFNTAEQAVEKHTHCPICNANLHFNHLTDFARNLTHETAQCPECGIRVRNLTHRLH